eukprot:gnl/TRDRNA2_/TRDRNA2_95016_c0_seq1.p1 gnl/TRDRNA2_/TRDRNA2_95016_c0~~gnl/TRDRNA2_/TRDRNA2_95016_c0_seq1.p1  ORF type:complete len:131 (-),score=21.58 gnl/TRDRNA2_/TRDRNA2_95016_c0_seq1:262-654(-)
MAGTGGGYLLGALLHATGKAPSQHVAETLGMAPGSSTKLLLLPAFAVLSVLCFQLQQKASENRWLEKIPMPIFGIASILGYMAGAYFADSKGYWAFMGTIFAFFAPVVAFVICTAVFIAFDTHSMNKKRN